MGRALALLLPALIFGLLVTAQWRVQQDRSEALVRYNAPLSEAANSLQREQTSLKAQLAELRARMDQIQASAASQSGIGNELETQIASLKERAGLTARTGDGVTITLDDTRALVAPKDVEKAICHSTDVTDIVNTAWRGGAVAIAVNDERIVGSSSAYCIGSTITVNGTLMSPPFQVNVIGDQAALLAAFDDPTQLRDIKQRRDVFGLGFRVNRASALKIPAYNGALTVKQATAK